MPPGLRALILRLFRVPEEPRPPAGENLRTFRAAPNFFLYRFVGWVIGNAFGFVGAVIGLIVLHYQVLPQMRPDVRVWAMGLELVGVTFVVGGALVSLAVLRLDYEMRWYLVTDRSLRIREGVWHLREMTMSFANIQNMNISQGPLQRLLGIADLRVQSAGGGGMAAGEGGKGHGGGLDMHRALFRGVSNASEIRDLMAQRLKALRDSGLGDLDESHHAEDVAGGETAPHGTLEELRAEAAALRAAAERLAATP